MSPGSIPSTDIVREPDKLHEWVFLVVIINLWDF